ncbi:MAG: ATP-dependent DNA helicase RecG [Nitrospirae bacterium]|nr:ATP-dependent DNA helicase RecG [Nitrospirota bacterium]
MSKLESLETILDRIQKPIRYAVQKNFAHLMKVQGLAAFVTQQVQTALAQNPSEEEARGWVRLKDLFADYDQLLEGERQDRLRKAQELLKILSHRPMGQSNSDPDRGLGPSDSRPNAVFWDRPMQYLKGVGPKRAEWLARLGIKTLEDFLYFLPWRYEDRSHLKPIAQVTPGEEQTVCGVVQSTHLTITSRRKFKIVEMLLGDESGSLLVKWFNQPYLQKRFKNGQRLMLFGKVKVNRRQGYGLEMENPVYEFLDDAVPAPARPAGGGGQEATTVGLHSGRIVPIYHETHGLTSRPVRSLMKTILDEYAPRLHEILPLSVLKTHHLVPISEALTQAHFPVPGTALESLNQGRSEAHRRLVFDEFFLLQLGLGLKRREASEESKGTAFETDGPYLKRFLAGLPYQLTAAQKGVLEEIKRDMARPHPMNRLLQGDVGCGKTVVALAAMVIAADNGHQAVLMVPTEILAEQHYLSLKQWLSPFKRPCLLLTGGQSKRETANALRIAASDEPAFVVGTHALIQGEVRFGRLGLVVVDEQHKFGVMQRALLQKKGYHPDVLIMTATPIPRTLALTVHGDLDLSVIDELPQGRAPIETRLAYESKRSQAYALVAEQVAEGRQAYVVYPIVEESEKTDLKAATQMADHLQREVFPSMKIGLLHGRMPMDEKERVMEAFKKGQIQILVATTVIEVGIDVPNATVMIIEHAERFGLSQLHQLRGRVGRGRHRSYCILLAAAPVSEEGKRRLNTMVRSHDGFVIAEEDLAIRGPGEFFGTRQSGLPELRVANILRDAKLLEEAREEAWKVLSNDPQLNRPEHAALKAALARKWKGKLELFTVS